MDKNRPCREICLHDPETFLYLPSALTYFQDPVHIVIKEACTYGIKAVIAGSAKAEHKIIEDSARKNLHKLMEAVILENGKSPDTQIDEYIAAGDASEEILKYAKEQSADMIVIGYKSYSAISEILVGSTAAKVARYAPCSVLIYRPEKA